MKQACPCCSRPYDDEWVIYCPVSRDLADKLRGEGLTTRTQANIKLAEDDTIVVTEITMTVAADVLAEMLAHTEKQETGEP